MNIAILTSVADVIDSKSYSWSDFRLAAGEAVFLWSHFATGTLLLAETSLLITTPDEEKGLKRV